MTPLLRSVLASALLCCVAGCEVGSTDAAAGTWIGTVDTLPSGRLLVRNLEADDTTRLERWNLRELYRVGSLDGAPETVFGDVGDVELGPDGSLYVLDSQATEIRVFGDGGAHRLTFGRQGKGPGELSFPAGMTVGPDGNLWVMNWGNGRYSVFDPATGSLVAEHRRLVSFAVVPWPGSFDDQGRLVDTGLGADENPAIVVLDSAYAPHDTLPTPSPELNSIRFLREGRLVMLTFDPFAPQPEWSVWPAGGAVYGEGNAYRLHYVRFGGDTVMTVEVERDPVPVTAAEADSALASFREMAAESGTTPEREPQILPVKPAHGALFVDQEGRTWVRRTERAGEAPSWDVLGTDGRLIAYVALPVHGVGGRPAVVGRRLALSATVDDVPTVLVYELTRPGQSP